MKDRLQCEPATHEPRWAHPYEFATLSRSDHNVCPIFGPFGAGIFHL